MNRALAIAVPLAAFLLTGAAAWAAPGLAPPPGTEVRAADLDETMCRTMAPVVGTRLGGTRQCATQREWDRIRRDSQSATEHTQKNTPFGYNNP